MRIRLTNCSLINKNLLILDRAIQIEDGLIEAKGSMQDSIRWPKADKELSLTGYIVLPGLMDAHMHLLNWALRHNQPSLDDVRSIDELLLLLGNQVHKQQEEGDSRPIVLGGWNEELYPEHRPPTLQELDEISGQIPIVLTRICGHVCVVNSAILRDFAWQEFASKEPGSVGFDQDGQPNGFLSESAMMKLLSLHENMSNNKQKELLLLGLKSMAAYGLTAIASQETNSLDDLDFLTALMEIYEKEEALPAYCAQIGLSHPDEIPEFLALREEFRGHPDITISSIKLFKDGSLGGRTALLHEPYCDEPSKTGLDLIPYTDLLQWFQKANKAGVQLTIHAIGDRAIAEIISAFTEACRTDPERANPNRHTIIHCQITDDDLLRRLSETNLAVIAQPLFARSDWSMALSRLGETRRNLAYDYRCVVDLGIHQAFSSDSPIESANPLLTLAAAIDHPQPDKSLSLSEAVAASSVEVAYILGMEGKSGQLDPGSPADITVIKARSEAELQAASLRQLSIALTIREGKIIYRDPEIQY